MIESPKAAAAFTAYCELGPDRSLALLAEKLYAKRGQNLAQLKLWSAAHHWQERVAAYDAAQRDRGRAQREAADAERARRKMEREIKREAAREAMDDARAKVFGAEWAKVLKAINEKIDANDVKGLVGLTQLMARALDEERLSLGSATAITEQQGAATLRIEYVNDWRATNTTADATPGAADRPPPGETL